MKFFTTILAIFLFNFFAFSQINYPGSAVTYTECIGSCTTVNATYSLNIDTFQTQQTVSDFGPRRLCSPKPYNFHEGLDYSAVSSGEDIGYLLRAIVGGEVYAVRGSGSLKYIIIEDDNSNQHYGYLHLYKDQILSAYNWGSARLVRLTNPTTQYGILTIENSDTTLLAACGNNCASWYYTLPEGDTIFTTNQVGQGDIIGALGHSGGIAQSSSHLHLQRYRDISLGVQKDNRIDPLEVVQHQGPEYHITIHNQGNDNCDFDNFPQGVEMKYPGTDNTTIMVRPKMLDSINGGQNNTQKYYNNTLNINQVALKTKPSSSNDTFQTIKGPYFESKIKIGAREDDHIAYPDRISLDLTCSSCGGGVDCSMQQLSQYQGYWETTGVFPFAYRESSSLHAPCSSTGGRPWDDFYFSDFFSRIHELDPMDGTTTPTMIANCPQNARYNDGEYDIFAQVTDVRDNTFASDTLQFTLDNFKPFIEYISINLGTVEIYEKEWACHDCGNNGGVYLTTGNTASAVTYQDINQGMFVSVSTSEPMDSLSLYIPVFGQTYTPVSPGSGNENGMDWMFQIPLDTSMTGNFFSFQFSGHDSNGNELLELHNSTQSSCVVLPVRTGQSTWSDNMITGVDSTHAFSLGCGSNGFNPPEIPEITIISDPICFEVTNSIQFTSSENATDGAISIGVTGAIAPYSFVWSTGDTTQNIQNLGVGQYCLTISDQFCCSENYCFDVEVCPKIIITEPKITNPSTCTSNDGSIWFKFGGANGGVEPYSYTWSNGYDGLYLNNNLQAGTYYVTVTDANGCTAEGSYELLGQGTPQISIGSDVACPGVANGSAIAYGITEDGSSNSHFGYSSLIWYISAMQKKICVMFLQGKILNTLLRDSQNFTLVFKSCKIFLKYWQLLC